MTSSSDSPDHPSAETRRRPRGRTFSSSKSLLPTRGTLLRSGLPRLMDERSDPNFRDVFGLLARRSGTLDAAVSRIRLSGLDLRPEELRTLEKIRVLLGEVNAITLRSEAEACLADPRKASNLSNLVHLMEEGIISVRSAPLAGWAPDFSVFGRSGRAWMVLVGLHWFARPYPHGGPALASLHGPEAAKRAARRFSHLWRGAHDIGPAILRILTEAHLRSGASSGSRSPDRPDRPEPDRPTESP